MSDTEQPDGTALDEEVDGVTVRTVVNDFKDGAFRDHYLSASMAREFRRFVEEFGPEIIHFQHLIGLSADLPAVARSTGARVVATVHDYWYVCQRVMFQNPRVGACGGPAQQSCLACVMGPDEPVRRWWQRLDDRWHSGGSAGAPCGPPANRERFAQLRGALACYERIDTPSRFVIDEFARQGMPLPTDCTRAVALGVDHAGFSSSEPPQALPVGEERPLRVGFVGHSLPHKGPLILLEALQQLRGRPIQVDLWGKRWPDHAYDTAIESLLAADPRATHHGRFAAGSLPAALAACDVLAVPSTCLETFGLATREAFLAGRPVVTTDRGALPESVRDGIDGLIVAGDAPGAFAAALARLLDEEDLLPALARGAKQAARGVKTLEEFARETEEFLYA